MKRSMIIVPAAALFACTPPSHWPLAGPESLAGDPADRSR
jgi:hypothetical protein